MRGAQVIKRLHSPSGTLKKETLAMAPRAWDAWRRLVLIRLSRDAGNRPMLELPMHG